MSNLIQDKHDDAHKNMLKNASDTLVYLRGLWQSTGLSQREIVEVLAGELRQNIDPAKVRLVYELQGTSFTPRVEIMDNPQAKVTWTQDAPQTAEPIKPSDWYWSNDRQGFYKGVGLGTERASTVLHNKWFPFRDCFKNYEEECLKATVQTAEPIPEGVYWDTQAETFRTSQPDTRIRELGWKDTFVTKWWDRRHEFPVWSVQSPVVASVAEPKKPIPEGVYYWIKHNDFYSIHHKTMGTKFFNEWYPRRDEFPQSPGGVAMSTPLE